jgi:hypothetical protein
VRALPAAAAAGLDLSFSWGLLFNDVVVCWCYLELVGRAPGRSRQLVEACRGIAARTRTKFGIALRVHRVVLWYSSAVSDVSAGATFRSVLTSIAGWTGDGTAKLA